MPGGVGGKAREGLPIPIDSDSAEFFSLSIDTKSRVLVLLRATEMGRFGAFGQWPLRLSFLPLAPRQDSAQMRLWNILLGLQNIVDSSHILHQHRLAAVFIQSSASSVCCHIARISSRYSQA